MHNNAVSHIHNMYTMTIVYYNTVMIVLWHCYNINYTRMNALNSHCDQSNKTNVQCRTTFSVYVI